MRTIKHGKDSDRKQKHANIQCLKIWGAHRGMITCVSHFSLFSPVVIGAIIRALRLDVEISEK